MSKIEKPCERKMVEAVVKSKDASATEIIVKGESKISDQLKKTDVRAYKSDDDILTRVTEMENESVKLKQLLVNGDYQYSYKPAIYQMPSSTTLSQSSIEYAPSTSSESSIDSTEETDSRSIYVGNVDYSTTAEELQAHFNKCGFINRVTIQSTFNGHPKGFAYIEFKSKDFVNNALSLNKSLFKGRLLKVNLKRMNIPGMNAAVRRIPPSFRGGFHNITYHTRGYKQQYPTRGGYQKPKYSPY